MSDSLLATRGYNTPPDSAPYLPVSSLDLVAKNFQAAAAAAQFSQVSSIKPVFVINQLFCASFIDKFIGEKKKKVEINTLMSSVHSIQFHSIQIVVVDVFQEYVPCKCT